MNIKTNILQCQQDFPILKQTIHGQRLAYLDNAATTQKPQSVIDALSHYYTHLNANVHRGVHHLSEKATEAFDAARGAVQSFIHAPFAKECIFVRSSTEAINLVARSFGDAFVKPGDDILISALEHHSNIVPWQMLCQRVGARLNVIPINHQGEIQLDTLKTLLTPNTKLLAITHASNALGTLNPIREIIQIAHAHGVPVLVDGAQSAPHLKIDVQELDCDFFVFSSHKLYGPTGVGVLYGKSKWLEIMPPFHGGGDMIKSVTFEKSTYQEIPFKFEAGTPAIAEVIGLKAAIEYLNQIGFEAIHHHEQTLLKYLKEKLKAIPNVQLIGEGTQNIGVVSFVMDGIHPHDIGSIVDQMGVAIRTGHHCAMPIMDFFQVPATARVSLGIYNTEEDIDQLAIALNEVNRVFKRSPSENT